MSASAPTPPARSAVPHRRRPAARPPGRDWRVLAVGLAVVVWFGTAPWVAAAPAATRSGPGEGALRLDASTAYLEGIDVSHWQGTINWPKVGASGKKFVIMKATESVDYTDPTYVTNHAGAKAAGLWTGAYHFAQPDASPNDAILEADHFVSGLNLGVGDLNPALDLEQSGGLSTTALQAWVSSFVYEVQARIGARPMIYTSPAFWRRYMGDSSTLADAGFKTLWIAHWGVPTPTLPARNWGGRGWTFWQYSNCGTVSGISGCVDLDRYNGLDLAPQAYSIFTLAAATPTGTVKQGQGLSSIVRISRTNFASGVTFDVTGLPAGTTAVFDANPSSDATAKLTITTPADPAATPTRTYPLTITGTGNGITRTAKMNLVVADGIPPTLTAPFTSLVTGTLGPSTAPVRVTWAASDPSGIAAGGLQRSINSGSWSGVSLPSATARIASEAAPLAAFVQQRARATDTKANTSGWTAGPIVHTMLTEQSGGSITYTGAWHSVAASGASGGRVKYATSAGAAATYRFTGSSVAWVAMRGPGRGSARIYVDGRYVRTISLASSTGHSRAVAFACNWLATGSHTLRISVVGTAGHPRVDVDAFVRLAI